MQRKYWLVENVLSSYDEEEEDGECLFEQYTQRRYVWTTYTIGTCNTSGETKANIECILEIMLTYGPIRFHDLRFCLFESEEEKESETYY